jgi:hypothetical protein
LRCYVPPLRDGAPAGFNGDSLGHLNRHADIDGHRVYRRAPSLGLTGATDAPSRAESGAECADLAGLLGIAIRLPPKRPPRPSADAHQRRSVSC